MDLRERSKTEWEKITRQKVHTVHILCILVRVVKLRRMVKAWHVTRMGDSRGLYGVLVG